MVWVAHHESRSRPLLIHFTGFIQGVQQAMLRYFESYTFQLLVADSRLLSPQRGGDFRMHKAIQ